MEKSSLSGNYYDILKLRSDCTDKDIRDAFLKLSKQFHPDVKGPKSSSAETAEFIKISEAYQTLSKPRLRKIYDDSLKAASYSTHDSYGYNSDGIHRPWEIRPNYNPNPGPYYGIKGINKISNTTLAFALIMFGLFGGLTGLSLVKYAFTNSQAQLDKISERANEHHRKLREEVQRFSTKEQINRVAQRIKKNERK